MCNMLHNALDFHNTFFIQFCILDTKNDARILGKKIQRRERNEVS